MENVADQRQDYVSRAQNLLDETFGAARARLLCLLLVSDHPSASPLVLPPSPSKIVESNGFELKSDAERGRKVFFNSNSNCQTGANVEILGIFVLSSSLFILTNLSNRVKFLNAFKVAPLRHILSVDEKQKKTLSTLTSTMTGGGTTITLHEIQKALYLLERFNPGYLELLCVPTENYICMSPEWLRIMRLHTKTLHAVRTLFSFSNLVLSYHKNLHKDFKLHVTEKKDWKEIEVSCAQNPESKAEIARIYRWLELIEGLLGKSITLDALREMSTDMRKVVRLDKRDEEVVGEANAILLGIRRAQLEEDDNF